MFDDELFAFDEYFVPGKAMTEQEEEQADATNERDYKGAPRRMASGE